MITKIVFSLALNTAQNQTVQLHKEEKVPGKDDRAEQKLVLNLKK